jgi:hypothetical protein
MVMYPLIRNARTGNSTTGRRVLIVAGTCRAAQQDVGLGAADAVGEEDGVVAVSAVLAQERRRVPEPGHRLLGW